MGEYRSNRSEVLGGEWLMAAIPGRGICRVFLPDQEPIDPGRELAREIEAERWGALEMSLRASGQLDDADTVGRPWVDDARRATSSDPGADFMAQFGKGGR